MSDPTDRYSRILAALFAEKHQPGSTEITFQRDEFNRIAAAFDVVLPKNLGDVVYSFRYRKSLPDSIRQTAPEGYEWVIRPAGRAQYRLVLAPLLRINPTPGMVETKLLDATPGIIARYALTDEQALLARLRYNRLIDIFTGLTCYSLQNHLRTTVPNMGQVETDEVYIGVNRQGAHYVLPVQAKSRRDRIGPIQIEQDVGMCRTKFPGLVCRPLAAQLMEDNVIALFEFVDTPDGVRLRIEQHYRLVLREALSDNELAHYRQLSAES
jgi:hypothetical protein